MYALATYNNIYETITQEIVIIRLNRQRRTSHCGEAWGRFMSSSGLLWVDKKKKNPGNSCIIYLS